MKHWGKFYKSLGLTIAVFGILAGTAWAANSPFDDQSGQRQAIPYGIATGPDGNLWFTEGAGNGIAKLTPAGELKQYRVPTANANPAGITVGPNQDLWFTETTSDKIGRVTTDGSFTEFSISTANAEPLGITLGSDGNLWFSESSSGKMAKITPAGEITEFDLSSQSQPGFITTGTDGNVWFPESGTNLIGRVTPAGSITEYQIPTSRSQPTAVAAGPDGNLWFTEYAGNRIGKITTDGVMTEFNLPLANSKPFFVTAGPDGNLWFSQVGGNHLGRITPAGEISEFNVPSNDSTPSGIVAGPDGNLWFTEFVGLPQWLRFIQTIPRPIAIATPYILLALLAMAASRFIQQAYHEARRHQQLQNLRKQQTIQSEERENFTNLLYHYFNTPISLITGGYELLTSQKLVPQALATQQIDIAHQIAETSRQLIRQAQAEVTPPPTPAPAWRLWPVTAGVLSLGGVLGLSQWLFYRAGLIAPSQAAIVLAMVAFMVLAQMAIFFRRNYALKQRQTSIEQALIDQSQALINSRSEFLAGIADAIGAQVVRLQAGAKLLGPAVKANPMTETLNNGIGRLQTLLSRLSLMNQVVVARPALEPVELSQIVQNLILSRSNESTAKRLQIESSLPPMQSLSMHGNYTAMVIGSLLDNAIKFSPQGGQVTVSAIEADDHFVLTITDHGPGIEPERLQELFQPFSRAGSTLEFNYEGVGLSLYFDKILMAKMGGSIGLASTPGTGTSVTINLPKASNRAAAAKNPSANFSPQPSPI